MPGFCDTGACNDLGKLYSRWDSNPHCTAPKAVVSAVGLREQTRTLTAAIFFFDPLFSLESRDSPRLMLVFRKTGAPLNTSHETQLLLIYSTD